MNESFCDYHSINEKKKKPILKWATGLNTRFSKEDVQMVNNYMKICSKSRKWKSKPQQDTTHTY